MKKSYYERKIGGCIIAIESVDRGEFRVLIMMSRGWWSVPRVTLLQQVVVAQVVAIGVRVRAVGIRGVRVGIRVDGVARVPAGVVAVAQEELLSSFLVLLLLSSEDADGQSHQNEQTL